jgi:hypothetical protein
MDRMTSHPYTSAKARATKRAAAKTVAAPAIQIVKPAAPLAAKPVACITQAKHKRLREMLRELRIGAEALSANADGLLSRLS